VAAAAQNAAMTMQAGARGPGARPRLRPALRRALRRLALWGLRLLERVPLSYRVGAAGVALVLVLVFNALIALQSAQHVFQQQELLSTGVSAQHHIDLILSDIKDVETGVRGYFIGGEPRYLEPYQSGRKAAQKELEAIDAELQMTRNTPALDAQFHHDVAGFLDQAQVFVMMRGQMAGSPTLEDLQPLLERQKERMDALRDSAAALNLDQTRNNQSLDAISAHARQSARVSILIPSFISVLLAAFLCYLMVRDLRHRQALAGQREDLLQQERVARAEAEAANQAKDDFVSTVSHELRTPLQAILSWTQFLMRLLQADTPPPGQIDAQLRTIERNARVLTRMIDDLLDVSRAITGKLTLVTRRIDLADIVQSSLETARPAAAAKGVQLELSLAESPLWMVGDADRLRQVISNVIGNAVKFTQPGGKVSVRASRSHNRLEVQVLDTGIGIAPDLLPRIFERYVQGSVSSSRQYGGLGLGLAIVKHLVEMHGGQVRVHSAGTGQGAEFRLLLPIQAVAPADDAATAQAAAVPQLPEAEAAAPPAAPRLEGLRLLAVDDDADVRQVLARLLAEEGARVTTAGSVAEAMERLRFHHYDVVLSDIGMPEADGYELARLLRGLRERESATPASVPLIALTAFSRAEDARRVLDSGFDLHIGKPVDIEKLVAALQAHATASSHLPIELSAAPRR
jgi:signal transduction histidine kinase/CheY-like chemotaxis protein